MSGFGSPTSSIGLWEESCESLNRPRAESPRRARLTMAIASIAEEELVNLLPRGNKSARRYRLKLNGPDLRRSSEVGSEIRLGSHASTKNCYFKVISS